MPSIEENRGWGSYPWSDGGEEWSSGFGDTYQLWHGFLLPRIGGCLPAARVLEIAPGHGRCTEHLRWFADHLIVVDLVPECIEACRQRFAAASNVEYHVNDGRSLPMVADASIDFAFSWDSLVHVEMDALASYLGELRRTLRPAGRAFLHHSNLGEYVDGAGQTAVSAEHWRARTATARRVREVCQELGLECRAQELIPWGGAQYIDTFSFLRRPSLDERAPAETVIQEHPSYPAEGANLLRLRALYARDRVPEGRNLRQTARQATLARAAAESQGVPLRHRFVDRIHANLKAWIDRAPRLRSAIQRWLDR